MNLIFEYKFNDATFRLYENHIEIDHDYDETIAISLKKLNGVKFKKPSPVMGHIEFIYGDMKPKRKLGDLKDEADNVILFSRGQEELVAQSIFNMITDMM